MSVQRHLEPGRGSLCGLLHEPGDRTPGATESDVSDPIVGRTAAGFPAASAILKQASADVANGVFPTLRDALGIRIAEALTVRDERIAELEDALRGMHSLARDLRDGTAQ